MQITECNFSLCDEETACSILAYYKVPAKGKIDSCNAQTCMLFLFAQVLQQQKLCTHLCAL